MEIRQLTQTMSGLSGITCLVLLLLSARHHLRLLAKITIHKEGSDHV